MKRPEGFLVINRVISYLESVLFGCFLGCFGARNAERKRAKFLAESVSSEAKDPCVSEEQLDSLLDTKGVGEEGSPSREVVHLSLHGYRDSDVIGDDLEDEIKFLKTFGTLQETPEEMQRTSRQTAPLYSNENENLSGITPSSFSTRIQEAEQPILDLSNEVLPSSSSLHGEEIQGPEDFDPSGKSLQSERLSQNFGVKLEHESDIIASPCHNDSNSGSFQHTDSPFPTPIDITDAMQTPGTFYPVNLENLGTRKHPRDRTNVFPVLKPVENLLQWKDLREHSSHLVRSSNNSENQLRNYMTGSRKRKQQVSVSPVPRKVMSNDNSGYEKTPCTLVASENMNPILPEVHTSSLSRCTNSGQETFEVNTMEQCERWKGFDVDRPIIGFGAANWINNQQNQICSKQWDGNGIPNTTKKYKEDQTVHWHATPFEERLEKVLSDEKLLPHRKLLNRRPDDFEE